MTAYTIHKKHYSRILLLKIDNEIQSVVFSMYSNNNARNEHFNGEILITDLNGVFLNGYRITNGNVISQFMKGNFKSPSSLNKSFSNNCEIHSDDDSNCILNIQSLNEIVIPPKSGGITYLTLADLYGDHGGGSSSTCEVNCNSWNYGGAGDYSPVETDPCDEIKSQTTNPDYKAKIEILKGKTGLKMETGFSEKADGTFSELQNGSGGTNSNSMSFTIDSNTVGYMHTHVDPYESGRYNSDGEPELLAPIKMFSPADVGRFLELLVNAQTNNISIAEVYGTMISSSGTYNLRFDGNITDVRTDFNWKELKSSYVKAIEDYGLEKGFLKFIKENVGVNGISLYKIKTNGAIENKTLDLNSKLTTIPCQ
ncbi:hypothetical protein [Flavobacterium tiangeerense]|uniref:hypothetical protein n=1 Tax=Flavobacterium tiangeerense TaxID=459471 RepID=UPI0011A7A325|nr:hypothetical protein [Flavobacterium tiangeerense]